MRALVLTASSFRHEYFAQTISEHFDVCGIISQPKRQYYKKSVYESEKVLIHFERLKKVEEEYFGAASGYISTRKEDVLFADDINRESVVRWAVDKNPDVVFLFGTKILGAEWIGLFETIINLHLGLSPYYRGSATLFWPFVNRELHCVGATIHLAVEKVDAGPILKRVRPDIVVGDDYYDINCKAIKTGIDAVPSAAKNYLEGDLLAMNQSEMEKGKVWKKADFDVNALVKALSYLEDGITQQQLEEAKRDSICNFLQ